MALSKAVTMPTGAVAAYWSVLSMQAVMPPASKLNVYLGGFISSAAAAAGAPPLKTRFFQFAPSDLGVTDITTATPADVYAAIAAAVDVAPPAGSALGADELAGATSV